MEILSIGEKIKRSRIYKGLTLKDVCGGKVSVSKMSCIENGKVKPDDWIIEFVAKKLSIDVSYLKQDVHEQIGNNINEIKNNKNSEDYESKIEYNLGFAENYKYYDLAFKLMHLIFSYYLQQNKFEKLQITTSKYYDLCQKSGTDEDLCTYYMDTGRYCFGTKEYAEAAGYYNSVRKTAMKIGNNSFLARSTYNEAACYVMLENYERAYEIGVRLTELMDYFDTDLIKADAYQLLALLSIRRDKGKFEQYEKKSYELYGNDSLNKASAIYNYAVAMFDVGIRDMAVEYIKKSLSSYPKDDKTDYVDFMIRVIDELFEDNEFELAQGICDEALNLAIDLNNIKFVERAYYYKACILEKLGGIKSAEMFMNLSMDSLMKFGSKADIYKRYLEMGNMYYEMNETVDAIKYFDLAIKLEKSM
jgi:tetratricopeptide (TPR) repeat protein